MRMQDNNNNNEWVSRVAVTFVDPNGRCAACRVSEDDVITGINGMPLTTHTEDEVVNLVKTAPRPLRCAVNLIRL